MEQRMMALEIKVAYQDDLLETLNQQVIEQRQQIDALTRRLQVTEGQLRALLPLLFERPEDEPPPPHY